MNLSFEAFAYKRKSFVFSDESEDDEPVRLAKPKTNIISSDDEDNVDVIKKHPSRKKKRRLLSGSDEDELNNNSDGNEVESIRGSNSLDVPKDEEKTIEIVSDNEGDRLPYLDDSVGSELSVSLSETVDDVFILNFLSSASCADLISVDGFNKAKAKIVISLRPFSDWDDLTSKLGSAKGLTTQILSLCEDHIRSQRKIDKLLEHCQALADEIQNKLTSIRSCSPSKLPVQQPRASKESLKLKQYQLLGVNWLAMLHQEGVNGILADQMGLGKTVQAICFLGYLMKNGLEGPHLIIAPCSTVDNWVRELQLWLPDAHHIHYTGNQEERYQLRMGMKYGMPDIIVTSINTAISSKDDRMFFKKNPCQCLVLDEAHMVKNMKSNRFQHLSKIQASRKLLLTGTPLQNDLLELLSLLYFLVPDIGDHEELITELLEKQKKIQSSEKACKYNDREEAISNKNNMIIQVKKILDPFILRRLKEDVLCDLPPKKDQVIYCKFNSTQSALYKNFLANGNSLGDIEHKDWFSILMKLRKVSNHELLERFQYTEEILMNIAKDYCQNPEHFNCDVNIVFEDLAVMSDFEVHTLCKKDVYIRRYALEESLVCGSGKMKELDLLLPKLKAQGDRVLIFSQFVIMLDVLEIYLNVHKYRFLRIDGSTKAEDRQMLIDRYNNDNEIFIFLLSTRAGGLGINLTSANTVILHDIDFNPYNDKQAEDRCHRLGQTRQVTVYRLIVKDTIEENMLKLGEQKMKLEKKIVGGAEVDDGDTYSLIKMLTGQRKEQSVG